VCCNFVLYAVVLINVLIFHVKSSIQLLYPINHSFMECTELSGSRRVGTSRLVTCCWHISCDTKAFYTTVNADIRRHRSYAYFSPAVDEKFSGA